MRRLALIAALLAAPVPGLAQEHAEAPAGVLRWLDKLSGESGDMELSRGQSASNGRLTVQLDACRYPADNPMADAQAHLTVVDSTVAEPVFSGWMLASAPALSALDHPRYDVWVLRCAGPGIDPPPEAAAADEGEGDLPEGEPVNAGD
jgi:hypothetical protein